MNTSMTNIAIIGSKHFSQYAKEIEEAKTFQNVTIFALESPRIGDYQLMSEKLSKLDVDAVVLGPYDFQHLSIHTSIPTYIIRPNIIDFMILSKQIVDYSHTCIVMPIQENINLTALEDCLKVKFKKHFYRNRDDIEGLMKELKSEGIHTVLGNTAVCTYAELIDLQSHYYYGKDGMIDSIHNAVQLASNINKEKRQLREIETILANTINGVISTDSKGNIRYVNQPAFKILKIIPKELYDKNITDIIDSSIVKQVMEEGLSVKDISLLIKNTQIIANLIPIEIDSLIKGCCLVFESATKIMEYESIIRQEIKRKNFDTRYTFESISGTSESMEIAINNAKQFAKSDSTVLITAETGTGKEIFAQSMHNYSHRQPYSFVAINCGAIPDALIESELFGYETGSFTGAKAKGKQGLIELAHGGTVLLDDIDSISLSFQSKLLRVIQEREIIKIGGNKTIPVDVRFIVATNRNLKRLVEDGSFRNDLYYRLSVLKLTILPLRTRKEDIPLLYHCYIEQFDPILYSQIKSRISEIFSNAINYPYPGNVRELINITERFTALVDRKRIDDTEYLVRMLYDCLEDELADEDNNDFNIGCSISGNYTMDVKNMEKRILEHYIKENNGNMILLAKELGIGRTTLYAKIKEFGI